MEIPDEGNLLYQSPRGKARMRRRNGVRAGARVVTFRRYLPLSLCLLGVNAKSFMNGY